MLWKAREGAAGTGERHVWKLRDTDSLEIHSFVPSTHFYRDSTVREYVSRYDLRSEPADGTLNSVGGLQTPSQRGQAPEGRLVLAGGVPAKVADGSLMSPRTASQEQVSSGVGQPAL